MTRLEIFVDRGIALEAARAVGVPLWTKSGTSALGNGNAAWIVGWSLVLLGFPAPQQRGDGG